MGLKHFKLAKNGLVSAISRHMFELESPNLHQLCILESTKTLLKMVLIDLDLQGHLGKKTVQIGQKRTCLRNNF